MPLKVPIASESKRVMIGFGHHQSSLIDLRYYCTGTGSLLPSPVVSDATSLTWWSSSVRHPQSLACPSSFSITILNLVVTLLLYEKRGKSSSPSLFLKLSKEDGAVSDAASDECSVDWYSLWTDEANSAVKKSIDDAESSWKTLENHSNSNQGAESCIVSDTVVDLYWVVHQSATAIWRWMMHLRCGRQSTESVTL